VNAILCVFDVLEKGVELDPRVYEDVDGVVGREAALALALYHRHDVGVLLQYEMAVGPKDPICHHPAVASSPGIVKELFLIEPRGHFQRSRLADQKVQDKADSRQKRDDKNPTDDFGRLFAFDENNRNYRQ
jgi:hypothetical protein